MDKLTESETSNLNVVVSSSTNAISDSYTHNTDFHEKVTILHCHSKKKKKIAVAKFTKLVLFYNLIFFF